MRARRSKLSKLEQPTPPHTEAAMRSQIYQEHADNQLHFGSVRSPVQCQGMERGHRRIAEAAIAGSVNPQQFSMSDGLGLLSNILPIANLF
jgi:hypothetical protein